MKGILDTYTTDAIRTESKIDKITVNPIFLQSIIAMAIGAGNMLDQIKKHTFYGKEYNEDELKTDFTNIVNGLDGCRATFNIINEEKDLEVNPRTFHAIVGIATEATEMLEALNLENNNIDEINLLEELGDVMWYSSILVDSSNGDWTDILDTNISKLKARYPDKFTTTNATNRDLNTERTILESGLKS